VGKQSIYLFVIANIILFIISRLFWINFIFTICLLIPFLCFGKWFSKSNCLIKGISTLAAILLLTMVIKVFVVEVFIIPSSSMANTLRVGDVIVVSKVNYGPKMPLSLSEIPWFNYFISEDKKVEDRNLAFSSLRLKGFTTLKHGDIAVFKRQERGDTFIKRCVGLAGESFQIKKGIIWVDKRAVSPPPNSINCFRIWFNDSKSFFRFITEFPNKSYLDKSNYYDNYFKGTYDWKEIEEIKKQLSVDSIKIDSSYEEEGVFPQYDGFHNTRSAFRSVLIPYKGMTIKLDNQTFIFYKDVLSRYENVKMTIKNGWYYIDGQVKKSYTFKNNYYFMIGDNSVSSNDSRYYGFIPEGLVLGRAILKLYPNIEKI
jgi:signal peptidase I